MFTIADLRDIAVQIENNGEAAYRRASKNVKNPKLAELLAWMADEESRHAQWFASLKGVAVQDANLAQLESMGRALLQEMVRDQTFSLDAKRLEDAETIKAMLVQSRNFEQDTILFYETLRAFLDDPSAMEELDRIIAQEREHVAKLESFQSP